MDDGWRMTDEEDDEDEDEDDDDDTWQWQLHFWWMRAGMKQGIINWQYDAQLRDFSLPVFHVRNMNLGQVYNMGQYGSIWLIMGI